MSGLDRDESRRRLAEAFLKEAARLRFNPPAAAAPLSDEQREGYLQAAIDQLTDTLAAQAPGYSCKVDAHP